MRNSRMILFATVGVILSALTGPADSLSINAPGPVPTSDPVQYALDFDGSNDYIRIPGGASVDLRGSLTVAAWVKNRGGGRQAQIVWRGDTRGGMDPYSLQISDDGRLQFIIRLSSQTEIIAGTDSAIDQSFHYWAGVWDKAAGKLHLYKDGEPEADANISGEIQYDTAGMWNLIGAVDNGDWQDFNGVIDEVSIWNVALSQSQIRSQMLVDLRGDEAGLVGWWDFNEGAGQVAHDRSAFGNHGRLGNSTEADSADPTWVSSPEFPTLSVSGHIRTLEQRPMPGVRVESETLPSLSPLTDAEGYYLFGPVRFVGGYTDVLRPWKDGGYLFSPMLYASFFGGPVDMTGLDYVGRPIADIEDLVTYFYCRALGREPEQGAVEAWAAGYFESTLALNIGVQFIPREMGRLFFLSPEYAGRQHTDAEFITDCYRVFLLRDPEPGALAAWLAGRWDRVQALTAFAESREFTALVLRLFPGHAGNPTRNFVTTMYLGVFDRLPDEGGLLAWSAFLDASAEKREAAKLMAATLFDSQEYLEGNPTNNDLVIRLYRTFMGRYPSNVETIYWSLELEFGLITPGDAIVFFADSDEFTARLAKYLGPRRTAGSNWELY